LITWKKLISARVNFFVLSGFILLLTYLCVEDSYSLSFRAFLYLCPFLFLFFSQDMVNDEIRSGYLENVLFAGGRFRSYLLSKNVLISAGVLGLALVGFSGFALYGLTTRQWEAHFLGQFASSLLAGVYYVALAGFLSFFFRAGSNVLVILLGQGALFVGLLFTATQRMGLLERLTESSFPGAGAKLEFLAVSFVVPNIVIARRSWLNLLGLGMMTALFFSLQIWQIKSLEFQRK
jgi:ABC-type transport system involved in multi-copper enzyme maturation permease subunit